MDIHYTQQRLRSERLATPTLPVTGNAVRKEKISMRVQPEPSRTNTYTNNIQSPSDAALYYAPTNVHVISQDDDCSRHSSSSSDYGYSSSDTGSSCSSSD